MAPVHRSFQCRWLGRHPGLRSVLHRLRQYRGHGLRPGGRSARWRRLPIQGDSPGRRRSGSAPSAARQRGHSGSGDRSDVLAAPAAGAPDSSGVPFRGLRHRHRGHPRRGGPRLAPAGGAPLRPARVRTQLPRDLPQRADHARLPPRGPTAHAEVEARAVADLCAHRGGVAADPAAVDAWFEHRNTVPHWRELFEQGLVVDTIEVATQWSRLDRLYQAILDALRSEPAVVAASAHSSHAYRSGANLYFTFAAAPETGADMLDVYDACWRRAMQATQDLGGGIAHHHGIGRVRRDWLARELGPVGVRTLRSIKRALDPDDLMNPGVLIPSP
ncbi:MAG: FAD-linked oxidase C-terminal domain-containing protein [Gammaproteobacteria bacterium]|nr:FAD-linked oxidase C-terminal domain-containing protein [Gammaproteobacteria bacterium]